MSLDEAIRARRRADERNLPYEQALDDIGRIHDLAKATGMSPRQVEGLFDEAAGRITIVSRDRSKPSVCVADLRHPDSSAEPEHGRIYGFVRPSPRGFVVHQIGWAGQAERAADELVGPIEIGYHDPEAGKDRSRQIRAIAACPHDQWLWVETGWALDDPGRIADAHPLQQPAPELLYDVRWFWGPDRYHYGQEGSYRAMMPHWKLLAWCASAEWAHRIAAAIKTFPSGVNDALATQVQRPSLTGREVAATYIPDVHTGPALPPPVDPADWPAPAREVTQPITVFTNAGRPIPACELRVHTGEPGSSWQTVCWTLDWIAAERIAEDIGVGRPGTAWRFAEAWEIDELSREQVNPWKLAKRIPHDHGRLEHDPCDAWLDEASDAATTA